MERYMALDQVKQIISTSVVRLCRCVREKQSIIKHGKMIRSVIHVPSKSCHLMMEFYVIENYPCNDRKELRIREEYWIEQNKDNCINKKRAYSSPEASKSRR